MGNGAPTRFNSSSTAEEVIDYNVPEKYPDDFLVVITGCNTGIGFDTCKQFYRKGAHVIMACRTQEKMIQAKEQIEKEVQGGKLECMKLDLSSQQSVKDFLEEYKTKHGNEKLSLLINNAGVMACPLERTVDGLELQMASNHFGHYTLTLGLLPYMTDVPDARVVCLSSSMHRVGFWYWDPTDFNWEKRSYSAWGAYGQSKLANVIFAKGLSKRLANSTQGKNITVLSVDPGSIKTDLQRHSTLSVVMQGMMPFINKSIPQGAATTVSAATGAEFKGRGGAFLVDCNETVPQAKALDEQAAEDLWLESEKVTGVKFPLQ
jgi:NAD(P)-dependent dehydrogenase (short-subunit alcohol dehydrogenase family)